MSDLTSIHRPFVSRSVTIRVVAIVALLLAGMIAARSLVSSPVSAQGVDATPVAAEPLDKAYACVSPTNAQLRYAPEPVCQPGETLLAFNDPNIDIDNDLANGVNGIVLCAAVPTDPLRRATAADGCPNDLVVLTVPSESADTHFCVDIATGTFRLRQSDACAGEREQELVIPVSQTPVTVATSTPAPVSATPATPEAISGTEATPALTPEQVATSEFQAAGNQAPDPRDRRYFTLEDSASFLITLIATDADGNALSFSIVSPPSKGTIGSIFGTSCTGTIPKRCTASIRYKPLRNEYGYDTFVYRASDGAASALATVTIRIQGVNDAPTFTKGPNVTSPEDAPYNKKWATNVSEGPANEVTQSLMFVIVSNSNPALFAVGPAVSPSGRLSFTPAAEATGSALIKVRLHDSGGTAYGGDDTSSLYSFTVTITPANDAPSFTPGPDVTVDEDSGAYSAAWASNMSPGPLNESGQTTRFVVSSDDLALFAVRPAIDPAGVLTFTPAPDANGTAELRVRIRDDGSTSNPGDRYQSSPAYILTVTITPINDAPVASPGAATTNEDTAIAIDLAGLVSDVETADADLTFEIVTAPAHGTFGLGTYTPAADFNGSDSFTYRVIDRGDPDNCAAPPCAGPLTSTTETIAITITAVNDAPVNNLPGGQTINEDTPLVLSAGNGNLVSVSDVDAGSGDIEVTLTVDHGTLSLSGVTGLTFTAGDGSSDATMSFSGNIADINTALDGLSYAPAVNFNSDPDAEALSIETDDLGNTGSGGAQTDTDTVIITVTAVNDEPTFTLGGNQTVIQDAGAQTVNGFATAISAGPADESGQVLTFTVSNDNTALFSAQPDIDEATGNLTYTPAAGQTGSALVTVVLADNGGTAIGGDDTSGSQSFTITVNLPNALPVANAQSVTTDEDAAKVITLSGSDTEGATLAFAIGTGPGGGSLGAIGAVSCVGTPSACTADVTYTPNPNVNGPDSFTFTVNDGTSDSAPATVSITVTPVNDAPVLANIEAGALSYSENDSATTITASLTVSDIDSANLDGATVSITDNFSAGQDVLAFVDTPSIAGIYSGGVLTLTGTASLAEYQAALRSVTYANSSENPGTATRTISFQGNDGAAANNLSNIATRNITITSVNDAPVLANIEATTLSYTENDPATAITSSLTASDVDSTTLTGATVSITSNFATGEDVLGFSNQLGITGSYSAVTGVLTLTGTTSVANYQTALRSVTYANTSENPGVLMRTVSFQSNDGAALNNLSNTVSRDITVTAVDDAPILTGAKTYSAQTNLQISVPDGSSDLLAGWSDPEGGTVSIDAGSISATSPAGGVISSVNNSTGAFSFDPPAGVTGDVTFTYRVCDNSAPTPLCSANTTVTVNVTGPVIWFVDDSAAPGGVGTLARPLQTLAAAASAIGVNPGQRIFLFDGTYATGRTLNADEWLIGQGVTGFASFDALMSITPPVNTIARPALATGTATVQNTVALASGAQVRALSIISATNAGMTGSGGLTGVTVDQVAITTTTGAGLSINDVAGTLTFSSISVNGAATGISLTSVPAAVTVNGGTIAATTTASVLVSGGNAAVTINAAVSNTAGRTIQVDGRTGGTVTFGGAIAATGGTGILLQNNTTGSPAINFTNASKSLSTGANDALTLDNNDTATIAFTNGGLFITTTSGTGLKALNGLGSLSVPGTNSTIASSAGKAIDIDSATSVTATFATVSSAGSPSEGIRLNNVTGGTLSINGGAITNATNADVAISGGAGSLTYNGTITDDLGTLVSVASTTGGTKLFSGAISDGNDGDGSGIALTGNTGATISFGGGVVLSTGANPAFTATGGGTVNVTGSANTIVTTTGTALNVANTTIGASGLTFRSISANGAANGIVLNTTGSSGGLSVTGTGAAGSGGTIQNTTGRGASFINSSNIALTQMTFTNAGTTDLDADNSGLSTGDNLGTNAAIHLVTVTNISLSGLTISGGAEQGINGNTVSGFTLINSTITDVGNGPDEDGVHFYNMSGTSAITNTALSSTVAVPNTTGGDDLLNLQMQSGTLNLTITGGSAINANKGSGYLFGVRGSANATITFSGASSTNNFSGGIVADAFDTAVMNLTVTGSTSSGNNDQLSVSAGDSSSVDLSATGSTFSSSNTGDFGAINLLGSAFDTGYVLDAIISGNTVTTGNGLPTDAVGVFNAGGGTINAVISGNSIAYAGTQRVLLVQAGQDGSGQTNVTVTGNAIDIALDGTGDAVTGFLLQSAVTGPGNTSALCADVGGAGALKNIFTHSLGGTMAAGDVRARQRNDGTVRLPGYGGAAADTAAVVAYLTGRNTLVNSPTATATVASTGFAGGGACTQPSASRLGPVYAGAGGVVVAVTVPGNQAALLERRHFAIGEWR